MFEGTKNKKTGFDDVLTFGNKNKKTGFESLVMSSKKKERKSTPSTKIIKKSGFEEMIGRKKW